MATSGATPPAGCSFDRGCIFGQKNLRSVKTNCPADFKRADVGCGYKSLADTIMEGFAKLGELPSGETFGMKGITLKLRVLVIKLVGISSADTDSSTALS